MKSAIIAAAWLMFQLHFVPAMAEVPDDIRTSLTARGHALLIGVSKYENASWTPLPGVNNDIEGLSVGLAPHFATVESLVNPTADAIRSKLRRFLMGQWNQPGERLLIYYAGHGFSAFNQNSRLDGGYITGSDTPPCHGSDCNQAMANAIPFQEFDTLSREAPARHLLMLFDSCFSGSIFLTRSNDRDPIPLETLRAREALKTPVRYFITAGESNERVPANSHFAELLLRGIKGDADTAGAGFITSETLGAYMQRYLPREAGMNIHPQKGAIHDIKLGAGQFLFLTSLAKPSILLSAAPGASPYLGIPMGPAVTGQVYDSMGASLMSAEEKLADVNKVLQGGGDVSNEDMERIKRATAQVTSSTQSMKALNGSKKATAKAIARNL